MTSQEHKRENKHIATGTNPQPWGWTTPSSSWWPSGWWRWPTEMIPPPAGCRKGSRLVFGGYRALRRRNFWSRVISDGFSIYRIYWRRFHANMGLEVSTTHRGKPAHQARPGVLCPTPSPSGPSTKLRGSLLFEKIIKKFRGVWTSFDIDFLWCKKHAKNSNWHLALCQ